MSLDHGRTHGDVPFRRAVVTGASGRTGGLFARALARRGVPLFITDIDKVPLQRLARETGGDAAVCDLLSEHGVGALAGRIFLGGEADLLINAGGSGYVRTLGMMRLAREFARRRAARPATLINVAPARVSAVRAQPFEYAGSPVAFHRLSQGLATRHSDRLRVIAIDPPDLDSQVEDFVDQFFSDAAWPGESDAIDRRLSGFEQMSSRSIDGRSRHIR